MIERGDLDLLAGLYDRFAHALDPMSEDRDLAERQFLSELARLYEIQQPPKPDMKEFQKFGKSRPYGKMGPRSGSPT